MIPPPLVGLRAVSAVELCVRRGVGPRHLGGTVYDKASRTSLWRLARDEDVVVQSESTAWDVAITCSGLMWARTPQPWPARERAALMSGYLRAMAD